MCDFALSRRQYIRDVFFFNDTATTEIYTLSLHDALPIWGRSDRRQAPGGATRWEHHGAERRSGAGERRSEEHTSELQSPDHLVCRLLLEKKKKENVIFWGYACWRGLDF